MSLEVALQSVLFYVLSCSTCAKINHRRKAKTQAKKEREEKHRLESEQPGLYRHPSPFSTNPYWTEEIMMGPGPPKKNADKAGSKTPSQKGLNPGPDSNYASSGVTETASNGTAVEGSRISGEGWNFKRYQREDEALWGHDTPGPGQRIKDAIAKAGSTAGRLLEGRLSRSGPSAEENPGTYYLAKNPPVNDLHPPVVSTRPVNRDETRWMLQPPPAAKIMEGKERVVRNRAGSNGSSRKGGDETPLSRQVTARLVDAKLQNGEDQSYLEVQPQITRGLSHSSRERRRQRDRDPSPDSSDSSDTVMRRKQKPSAPRKPSDSVNSNPSPTTEMRQLAARPPLETIVSSSNAIPTMGGDKEGPLREKPISASHNAMNTRTQRPSSRLSPNVNSMPAAIPSVQSKFPGAQTFVFPHPEKAENADHLNKDSLRAAVA